MLGTAGYGTAEGCFSWYLPIGRVTVVPSLYGIQALSPNQPLIRLPALDGSPRAIERSVGMPPVAGEQLLWNLFSLDLSVRPDLGRVFQYRVPITDQTGEVLGTNLYSIHLVAGLSWFVSMSDVGVVSSVEANRIVNGVGVTLSLNGYTNGTSTGPVLSLQLFTTLDEIGHPEKWYVSFSEPLNPVTSGSWM